MSYFQKSHVEITILFAFLICKETSSERQRLPEPISESTTKVPPRLPPRPPLSPPSDATRSPALIPPSERSRVREAGVPVLPMPTAKGLSTCSLCFMHGYNGYSN